MKKKKIVLVIVLMLVFVVVSVLATFAISQHKLRYCQEYIPGQDGIKGNVDVQKYLDIHEDFAIGANGYGYAVFKNPKKAFDTFVVMYDKGIKRIQEEYGLDDISYNNYDDYKNLGWYLKWATDEEREQAFFVVEFLDTYENSFDYDYIVGEIFNPTKQSG